MFVVDEASPLRARVNLLDPDAVAAVPSTLRFRLDCETTGTTLIEWTDIAPASTFDLTIPAEANRIINQRNRFERKVLTVEANSGTQDQFPKDVTYAVRNMAGIR